MKYSTDDIKRYLECLLQLRACLEILDEMDEAVEASFQKEAQALGNKYPSSLDTPERVRRVDPHYLLNPPVEPTPPQKPVMYKPDLALAYGFMDRARLKNEAKERNRQAKERYEEEMRAYKEAVRTYPARLKEYERLSALDRKDLDSYNREMEEYRGAVEDYRKEQLEYLQDNFDQASDWIEEKREATESALNRLRAMNVVHERFIDNNEALAFFYDCLDIPTAFELGGPDGAYKQYMDWKERRKDHSEIMGGIGEIAKKVGKLEKEMYTLRRIASETSQKIEESRKEMEEVVDHYAAGMKRLERSARSMASSMESTAINTYLTRQNMVALDMLRSW